MKYLIFSAALFLSSGVTAECLDRQSVVVIVKEDRPPYTSGLIPAWISIMVRNAEAREFQLYMAFAKPSDKAPNSGSVCKVYFHFEDITGYIGGRIAEQPIKAAKIVDQFKCN